MKHASERKGVTAKHLWKPADTALWALSPQSSWGTDVSPAAPYWQCATGCHAGYHPTTSHSRQRIAINSLPIHSVKDAGQPTRTKWQCTDCLTRKQWHQDQKKRKCSWFRHHSRKASPLKVERREAPCKTHQGEPSWKPSKKTADLVQATRWSIFQDAPPQLWPWGFPGPLPHLPGDGHLCWPHGLWSPWCPWGMDWTEKTSGPLTMWQRVPQRASSFSRWCLPTKLT